MKRIFTLFIFCAIVWSSYAGPGTYYNSIDTTKTCAGLKTQLFNLISFNAFVISYSTVDNYYNRTDSKPAESGGGYVVAERYCSDNPNGLDYCNFRYPGSFCLSAPSDTLQCNCYNKEHVFPKSWFGTDVYPMYSDMHFVWPADNRINFYKSNFPIGYAKNPYFSSKNGSVVGISDPAKNFSYNSSNIFEPIDSFKGDFARAYLYVVTRYQDSLSSWLTRSTSNHVLDGNKYPGLDPWILQVCVQWSKLDPPSAFEKQRNDSVYEIQNNRNPYIDFPHWVEKVFGVDGNSSACISVGIKKNTGVDFTVFPNPAKELLHIQTRSSLAEGFIEVVDLTGRTLSLQQIVPGTTQAIPVSHLSKGTYLVRLNTQGADSVNIFVKE